MKQYHVCRHQLDWYGCYDKTMIPTPEKRLLGTDLRSRHTFIGSQNILMLAWNGNMPIKRNCLYCDKEFEVDDWRVKHRYGYYCSRSCSSNGNYDKINRLAKREILGEFTDFQKQILIGSLFGDATLTKPTNGVNYHFSVSHCDKQIEYLKYKRELLKPLVSKIDTYSRFDSRYNKIYTTHRFHTKSHPYLTELESIFYNNRKKVIPFELIEQLEPIGFAMWYLDDGRINHKSFSIASVCFEMNEVKKACKILSNKFNILCYPMKDKRIYISAKSYDKIISLIEPFTPNCMRYKL